MLPVYLEVPREAKKIINKNVGYMFELLKCTCEGVSYAEVLDSIYPSYILDIKLEKCVQTIKELYNMTQDNYEEKHWHHFMNGHCFIPFHGGLM